MSQTRKQKLELTWIGKEHRPRLEPRILIEDPERSYHAKHRVSGGDIFDNRLIFGDNLLALKALEQEFAGKIKCIYIDPPYNTGSAFEHYDDGVEHSIWLSLMRDRIELIRRLLSPDGSLWITIDDNEAHYLKIVCDEIFGRENFVTTVVWEKADSPAILRGSSRLTTTTSSFFQRIQIGFLSVFRAPRKQIQFIRIPTTTHVALGFLAIHMQISHIQEVSIP